MNLGLFKFAEQGIYTGSIPVIQKIHLKDIDDGALHFCILFIRTLSIVQFDKITTFQRLALFLSSGDKRGRAKGEVILDGGSLRQS
jgi:hypothetical protein